MQCETVEIAQIKLCPDVTEEAFLAAFQRFVDDLVRITPEPAIKSASSR